MEAISNVERVPSCGPKWASIAAWLTRLFRAAPAQDFPENSLTKLSDDHLRDLGIDPEALVKPSAAVVERLVLGEIGWRLPHRPTRR